MAILIVLCLLSILVGYLCGNITAGLIGVAIIFGLFIILNAALALWAFVKLRNLMKQDNDVKKIFSNKFPF